MDVIYLVRIVVIKKKKITFNQVVAGLIERIREESLKDMIVISKDLKIKK